jgi:hypothetical protein
VSFPGATFTTVPATIFGASAIDVVFAPSVPGSIAGSMTVVPLLPDGQVSVNWTFEHDNGVTCRAASDFRCCEEGLCDALDVTPNPDFWGLNKDYRSFLITNQLPSPIRQVDISFVPPIPNSPECQNGSHDGGMLLVDGASGGGAFNPPYNQIAVAAPYAANTVAFNLGLTFYCTWSGTVHLTVTHEDGSICEFDYGTWTITQGNTGKIRAIVRKDNDRVAATSFTVVNTEATASVRWLSVVPVSPAGLRLLAQSPRVYSPDRAARSAACQESRGSESSALFAFTKPIEPGDSSAVITILVAVDSSATAPPVLRLTTYDEEGNALQSDTAGVTTAVQTLGRTTLPGDFELLSSFPNPARGTITVNYLVGARARLRLDLYDERGGHVARIADDERGAGVQTVTYNASALPSGSYLLRLSSDSRSASMPVVIVR